MKNKLLYQLLSMAILAMVMGSCEKSQVYNNADEMVADALKHVKQISLDDFKVKYDEGEMFTLIDVREPSEYNLGFIPMAVNVPAGTLVFKIGNEEFWEHEMLYMPEKDELLIVNCKKGKRGILAAEALGKLGYTNVLNLEGGWKAWELKFPLIYEKNLDQVGHEEVEEEGGC